ncbi:SGNH/GDSL hydrolase family protein [Endozoicomonadaceae bacterium StTr2]
MRQFFKSFLYQLSGFIFYALILLLTHSQKPQAGTVIDQVILFGDSLSDTKNTYEVTSYLSGASDIPPELFSNYYYYFRLLTFHRLKDFLQPIPPAPCQFGRFSNGDIVTDHILRCLNLDYDIKQEFLNYAYSGSMLRPVVSQFSKWFHSWFIPTRYEAGDCNLLDISHNVKTGKTWMFPSMSKMVDYYIHAIENQKVPTPANRLVVIGNGGSDFINRPESAKAVYTEQRKIILRLIRTARVEHICWGTVPNPADTLCFSGKRRNDISLMVRDYNQRIREEFHRLKNTIKDVRFIFLDGERILEFLIQNAHAFGFTEVNQALSNLTFGDCDYCEGRVNVRKASLEDIVLKGNPEEHFYFDLIHPTARVHCFISLILSFTLIIEGYEVNCEYVQQMIVTLNIGNMEELFLDYFASSNAESKETIRQLFHPEE